MSEDGMSEAASNLCRETRGDHRWNDGVRRSGGGEGGDGGIYILYAAGILSSSNPEIPRHPLKASQLASHWIMLVVVELKGHDNDVPKNRSSCDSRRAAV